MVTVWGEVEGEVVTVLEIEKGKVDMVLEEGEVIMVMEDVEEEWKRVMVLEVIEVFKVLEKVEEEWEEAEKWRWSR